MSNIDEVGDLPLILADDVGPYVLCILHHDQPPAVFICQLKSEVLNKHKVFLAVLQLWGQP